MSSIRRAMAVVVGMGFASTLTLSPTLLGAGEDKVLPPVLEGAKRIARQQKVIQVQAQPVPIGGPQAAGKKDDKKAGADPVTLPTDRKAKQSIGVARDMIESQLWGEAARVLQALLDTKEDVFVEVERNGVNHWVSLHGEANRLLSTMPPQGRQFYELQFGARAKARLAEAKAKSDKNILGEVAHRYEQTEAGAEANKLLGDYNLDRGEFHDAALCYSRLTANPERLAKLPPATLFKATLAFRRTGELFKGKEGEAWKQKADKTWKQLAQAVRGGFRINDQKVTIEQLQAELDRYRAEDVVVGAFDWGLFKGNASRSAQGNGSAPFLEGRWYYSTWQQEPTKQWIEQAVKYQEDHNNPVLPGFFPIAVTVHTNNGTLPLLVYRSHWGIHARNLNKDGKLEWDAASRWSLDYINHPDNHELKLQTEQWQWPTLYLNTYPNFLYENSTVGTLSSDGKDVFVVEDLQLPPHPQCNPMQQLTWGQVPSFGKFTDALHHSKLQAFNLVTGKIVWELGGRGSENGDLADGYFLGPPLPLGDKLYVLIDKQSELRLVCLDPPRDTYAKPTVNWIQTLANVSNQNKMLLDVGRRMQGAQLSYGDGVLVCPTNAGVVVAVDVLSHSLMWAYNYREDPPTSAADNHPNAQQKQVVMMNGQRPANLNFDWKVSAPVIQEGKVVFTAPDAASLHCLDLRTGDLLWKQPRSDDLYLGGVYHGKVVLVGRTTCRALDLNSGRQVWRLETGMPSGQGTASDNVYYLPLKSGAQSHEPEVCAIDVDKGVILAHATSRKKEVPGNLTFFEGYVISQTADRITAYQQLRVKIQEIDLALETNPNDPRGLTARGEMKLGKGDLAGAVEDLRRALANKPPADILEKTRGKLFETLTELFQRDFNASEKYLDEYKAMCEVTIPDDATPEDRKRLEEERQNRQANFLCLLAKGREQQGRLVDAFRAYMEFSAKAADRNLVPVVDEPTIHVRPDVLAQGRIAAMVARATPGQRQPLEDLIAKQWAEVKAGNDLGALRRFVAVFGSLFNVGKEARFQLAERLMQENQPHSFLEAELHLLQLRRQDDPALAARAAEALARLMIRKGLLEDAAYWYRLLGQDYAQVVIRDGKTGADFFNALATDKRLLAYLDEPHSPWEGAHIKAKKGSGSATMQGLLPYEPDGEVLPFFQRNRVATQAGTLKLIDRNTGEERWSQPLGTGSAYNPYNMAGGQASARLPFGLQGHLMVVNVGTVVYALDPVDRTELWKHSLTGNTSTANGLAMVDKDGTPQVTYADGYFHKLGRTGPVEPSYVCLNTREGLMALDPLKGTVLWTRSDVLPRTHVFGDDQYVYLVEVRADGGVGNPRALRARDGVAVDVPDFTGVYQRRLRTMGRHILASENDPRGGQVVLRLYDVQTGKDAWKQTFKAGAVVLHSEEADLAGAVEPSNGGKVTVYDLRTRRKVLETQVDPKELDKVHEVHLLADRDFYYLASNRSPDQNPQMNPWGGGPYPTVTPGIRSLTANGMVYAFYRDPRRRAEKGALAWKVESPNLMVIVDQFKDLPILILSAWSQDMNMAQRGTIVQNATTRIFEKRTGKLLEEVKDQGRNNHQFHTLKADVRAGTIELIGHQQKITAYLDTDSRVAGPAAGGAPDAPKKDAPGTPAPGAQAPGLVPGVPAPRAVPAAVPPPPPPGRK